MTPPPPTTKRVRLEGTLDLVRASDSSFLLVLADGRAVPGTLVGRPISSLARELGRVLLVFGTGHFGAAGELERVEADGYIPNDGQPWTVSASDPPVSEEVHQELVRRFRATIGKWPGDETDEQINAALEELS